MKRNNVRNVPRNGSACCSFPNDNLYFEGGKDNHNTPVNRSGLYRSVIFIEGAYWNPVFGQ